MNDPLQDVVKALRETTSGEESGSARYTRSRILATVRQKKRRRVINLTFAFPLAAVLIGSAAWAASGRSLPVFVQNVSVALGLRAPPTLSKRVQPKTVAPRLVESLVATIPSANAAEEPAVVANAVEPEPSLAVLPSSATPSGSTSAKSIARTVAAQPRDSRVTEEELSLYESAHRAHFVSKDYGAALSAWQEYLRHAPRGRFALEANYNRALCLLRLGRTIDAREALEPFARGVYGNYRKAEALALIGKLEP